MEKTVHRTMSKLQGHHPILRELYHIALVVGGGLLAALGLEAFLIPHGFLDGGLTGISIILSKFIDIPVGVFIAVLNLPFIALTWWKLGRRSALRTTLGVIEPEERLRVGPVEARTLPGSLEELRSGEGRGP